MLTIFNCKELVIDNVGQGRKPCCGKKFDHKLTLQQKSGTQRTLTVFRRGRATKVVGNAKESYHKNTHHF